MGRADYFADGQWNFFCDFCGAKQKSGKAMKTWNGFYVCKHHKEVRNPQDFLRGIRENQSLPWTRPEKLPENFIFTCTLQTSSAIPSFALPGCMVPGKFNNAFLPSIEIMYGWAILDTSGSQVLDTNGLPIYPPGTPVEPTM